MKKEDSKQKERAQGERGEECAPVGDLERTVAWGACSNLGLCECNSQVRISTESHWQTKERRQQLDAEGKWEKGEE
eukprot:1666886-Rhodomonas_salina.2